MFNLDYLLIYKNDGTPCYSRCFGNMCKIAINDDVLFSAFLSSLSTFAAYNDGKQLDEIDVNGTQVQIEYAKDKKLNSLVIEDLKLIFLYTQSNEFTIAAGFDANQYEKHNGYEIVSSFLSKVEEFMEGHQNLNWGFIKMEDLLAFESELLRMVIHPFFATHSMKDKCPFGDNCPLRMAMYEGEGKTIYDRLKNIIITYRKKNIFRKMYLMFAPTKYKV